MHPASAFLETNEDGLRSLIAERGFGLIIAQGPNGPVRVVVAADSADAYAMNEKFGGGGSGGGTPFKTYGSSGQGLRVNSNVWG